MFGREISLPIDIMFGSPEDQRVEELTHKDYIYKLEEGLGYADEFARAHLRLSSDRMKRRYNVGTISNVYHKGDAVRYHTPKKKERFVSQVDQ
jgi:hypothetical protein